jgi:hypothetical protein
MRVMKSATVTRAPKWWMVDNVVQHHLALMSVERRAGVFKHRHVIAEIMPLTQRRQHAYVQGKPGHMDVLNAVITQVSV